MANRGELTPSAKAKMEKFLGRDATGTELRLYPYLQYVMMNHQSIDPQKINKDERQILSTLRSEGHIEGGASGMAITRQFWDFMCDVLFDTYVAHEAIDGSL